MPTYRVPVRVSLEGFIEVEAADVSAAHTAAHDLKSYENQGPEAPATWDWVNWGSRGKPVEVKS